MGEWVGGSVGWAVWYDFSSWTCPFPVGDMDRPLSKWGYALAPFPQLLSPQFTQCNVFQGYKVHLCVL